MDVPARPAPPLLAAGDQFEFDHTLRAQGHRDFAIEPLQRHRHEHADRVAQRRLYRSEEHTSELQSLMRISYAVFCLKKKKKQTIHRNSNIIKNERAESM